MEKKGRKTKVLKGREGVLVKEVGALKEEEWM